MEYWISVEGSREGPYTREQLLLMRIPANALVWREGMNQWLPAAQMEELVGLFTPYELQQSGVNPIPPRKSPPTYLVWAILSTFCCCLIPGIIAISYALGVKSKFDSGDYEGADKYSERAALWVILSFVLGLLMMPLQFAFMFL
jgi:hypothetical protein